MDELLTKLRGINKGAGKELALALVRDVETTRGQPDTVISLLLDAIEYAFTPADTQPLRCIQMDGEGRSALAFLEREAIGNRRVIEWCLRWLEADTNFYTFDIQWLLGTVAVGDVATIDRCLQWMENPSPDDDHIRAGGTILARIATGNVRIKDKCLGWVKTDPFDSQRCGSATYVLSSIAPDDAEVVTAFCDLVEERHDGWVALLLEESCVGNTEVIRRCQEWQESRSDDLVLQKLASEILSAVDPGGVPAIMVPA